MYDTVCPPLSQNGSLHLVTFLKPMMYSFIETNSWQCLNELNVVRCVELLKVCFVRSTKESEAQCICNVKINALINMTVKLPTDTPMYGEGMFK